MTKGAGAVAFLAGAGLLVPLLVLLPGAQAHGAPESRELDARVLLDDDGALGYGGCIELCVVPPEGLDLLALDVREAWRGDEPALVLRLLFQYEAVHDGRGFLLSLRSNGTLQELAIDSPDGLTYSSADFDRLDGPFDVGDGHPKALDAWVSFRSLGVQAGDALTDITLHSTHHGEPDDAMPGTWFSQGTEVPHLPHDPADPLEAVAATTPGAYTLKGPAPLLDLAPAAALVDLAVARNVTLTLGNPLTSLAQSAQVTLLPPAGVLASLAGADLEGRLELNLDPGATRSLTLDVAPGSLGGPVRIVATSDLGGRSLAVIEVAPVPPAPSNTTTTPTTAPPQDAADTPGPGAMLGLAALLGVAVARRPNRRA